MRFAFTFLCILGSLAPALAASPPAAVESKMDNTTISLSCGGKPALDYLYAQVPFKPYAVHLFTPAGANVLRDAPSDHLHHHALMFAWKVDGINFWEEAKSPGVQKGGRRSVDGSGLWHDIDWLAPDKKDTLLLERRRILLQNSSDAAATLITWQSTFSAPAGKDSVKITGSHYHGLGLRFLKSMDEAGEFCNATNNPGVVFRGQERLTTSPWCAYIASAEGKPVTVAMFDREGNPRPATFFTMQKPFAYLSATMKVHENPLVLEKGKPITVTYGVAAWDGKIDREQIDKLYKAWLKLPISSVQAR